MTPTLLEAPEVPAVDVRALPLGALHESAHNPRTRFDPGALQELADNLARVGQTTPLLVRPHPEIPEAFEIAAGACRRRAAALAGLPHLLAVVRPLDDAAFVELVNVENNRRTDLHPLEEARGFRDWMTTAGLDAAAIAARLGTTERYVVDRIRLLQLTPAAQTLFLGGHFSLAHAILLARLTPEQQARAIASDRSGNGRVGGLFVADRLVDEDEDALLPLDDPRRSKPVSVREFQHWIDTTCRFDPAREPALAFDFPATAAALEAAKAEELKVVAITREWRVPDDAKDSAERTYGVQSWKRADGQAEPSGWGRDQGPPKSCEHAVMGVVVAGFGRGEAFPVCIARQQCAVHWKREQRESRQRQGESRVATATRERDQRARYEAQQQAEARERARWEKATPELRKAFEAALAKADTKPGSRLAQVVLEACGVKVKKGAAPKTHEELIRLAGGAYLTDGLWRSGWNLLRNGQKALGVLGIDARAIVDRVAPDETSANPAAPAGKPTKRLAGDVRRAKAKQKAKAKASR